MKGGDQHDVVDWRGEVTGGGGRVIEKKGGQSLYTIQFNRKASISLPRRHKRPKMIDWKISHLLIIVHNSVLGLVSRAPSLLHVFTPFFQLTRNKS